MIMSGILCCIASVRGPHRVAQTPHAEDEHRPPPLLLLLLLLPSLPAVLSLSAVAAPLACVWGAQWGCGSAPPGPGALLCSPGD
jgi:hypothetical protein